MRLARPFALVVTFACGALLVGPAHATVTMDWVPVGNPGNAPDPTITVVGGSPHGNCIGPNCGEVDYNYYISKYDVTNAQYAEFLNAVDPTGSNTLGLFYSGMSTDASNGGITNTGSVGSVYRAKLGFENDPVVYVTFSDTLRFANWLNNGQGSASTDTGAYTLLGGTPTPSNIETVTRTPGAITFLPSENEWYKATYYNPATSTYFAYPAGSNTPTVCAAPGATANTANCSPGGPGHVTPVGAYTASASPYGMFDSGGNVFDWNEQTAAGNQLRGVRGGGWPNYPGYLAASDAGTFGLGVDASNPNGSYTVGFRVASLVPEPGTGLLVMAGLLGVAARRRRA